MHSSDSTVAPQSKRIAKRVNITYASCEITVHKAEECAFGRILLDHKTYYKVWNLGDYRHGTSINHKTEKKTLRFEMKRVRLLIGLQNTWLALCLHARVCHGCLVSYPGILAPMDCLKLARSRHRDDPREPQKFSWKVLEGSGRCVFFLLSTCFLHRKLAYSDVTGTNVQSNIFFHLQIRRLLRFDNLNCVHQSFTLMR